MAPSKKPEPIPWTHVSLDNGFWGPRAETNRTVTLPHAHNELKKTGRIEALKLKWRTGDPNPPHIFWDSDVAKWLEAAAYSLGTHPDRALERKVDQAIDLLGRAQQRDGYLNTHFTVVEPKKRWTNLRDRHELYCAGHLIEAAVAHFRATGKRSLLDIMCRYADLIVRTFGRKRGQMRGYPGHEELELALVKLHQATGNDDYLSLATYFIDERGQRPHYYDKEARARGESPDDFHFSSYAYNQSHLPVREQTEVVGHAVRAMYLYSAMADVAAANGDKTLFAAAKRLWHNTTRKRMHLTGGIGPISANEGFTFDYDLPTESAYLETCAAIGLVFFAQRMLHADPAADPNGEYADVMERALYNGFLSGVSLGGDAFFYGNPLAAYPGMCRGTHMGPEYQFRRSPWFGCACCPPNAARLLASLGGYVASQSNRGLFVHLYANGTIRAAVGGRSIELRQQTAYPWKDKVRLSVRPEAPTTFTLALRIPGWCRDAKLKINGKPARLKPLLRRGYAHIQREWKRDDRVELTLPMPVERIESHPHARQTAGRVALMRGPLVYCLEETDNGPDLNDLALPRNARFTVRSDKALFGGTPVLRTKGRRREADWGGELYRPLRGKTRAAPIEAIPYFMWANREPGEMLVWLRDD